MHYPWERLLDDNIIIFMITLLFPWQHIFFMTTFFNRIATYFNRIAIYFTPHNNIFFLIIQKPKYVIILCKFKHLLLLYQQLNIWKVCISSHVIRGEMYFGMLSVSWLWHVEKWSNYKYHNDSRCIIYQCMFVSTFIVIGSLAARR